MAGTANELLEAVGLSANGPYRWGSAVVPNAPGVYVVETPSAYAAAPIDLEQATAWIERVPTLMVDGHRPTPTELARRLAEFWIPTDRVVYFGLAGTSVKRRVRAFDRTPLGDPRPHAGGHWLKTLNCLADLQVWTARTDEPAGYEHELLTAFSRRSEANRPEGGAGLILPFANRQSAAGVRKQHGISGSTLPRMPRENSVTRDATALSSRQTAGGGGRLAAINKSLQAFACSQPSRRVTAVDAAAQLDRIGVLRDSSSRPGLPLRKLLRARQIPHAYQERGRWWYIECGESQH